MHLWPVGEQGGGCLQRAGLRTPAQGRPSSGSCPPDVLHPVHQTPNLQAARVFPCGGGGTTVQLGECDREWAGTALAPSP